MHADRAGQNRADGVLDDPAVSHKTPPFWIGLALTATLAVVLAAPGLQFAYVFDDYSFLGRAQNLHPTDLLPHQDDVFYRPVSREVYFGFLERVAPGNPMLGHVLNLILFVAIVVVTGGITARLAGPRAGVLAGTLLVLFGHWPVLVAWVSGSQDLFAVLFVLMALRHELDGHRARALTMFGLGVLSKETAVVLAPALVACEWLRGGAKREMVAAATRYGVVVLAWMLIHPGFSDILSDRGTLGSGSYIGLDNPNRWNALLQSLPGLLNLPLTGNPTPWPTHLNLVVVLAGLPLAAVLWWLGRKTEVRQSEATRSALRSDKLTLFAAILAVPPLLLTCLLVKHWVPYYLCFSMVGVSLLLAHLLQRVRYGVVALLLVAYAIGGVWSRGVILPPGMPGERSLMPAGVALRTLEKNFRRLEPTLPNGALVYVSTMATGDKSVYLHLHHFQVLRVWYRDPAIETLRPELRIAESESELLFWIDPDLEIGEIDARSLAAHSSGEVVDRRRYRSTLRSYAFGLAGSGELQRAVDVLLRLDQPDSWDHAVSYRMAATLVFAYGPPAVAKEMLEGVPELPKTAAFASVGSIMTIPTRGVHLEQAAFRAFGFSWDDGETVRKLLRALLDLGYHDASERLARRLLELAPQDLEATDALARIRAVRRVGDRIIPPVRQLTIPPTGPGA